jgi:hypothetical protein
VPIDRRGRLEEEPFAYRRTKDGKVFVSWNGRQIMVLKGREAERFLAAVEGAEPRCAQLVMARITGHFKHGSGS